MTVQEYIQKLKNDPSFMKNVTEWRVLPARAGAVRRSFRQMLDPRVVQTCCVRAASNSPTFTRAWPLKPRLRGSDFVVVTPTASGQDAVLQRAGAECDFEGSRPPARCTCFPPRRFPAIRWPNCIP